ncbi:MAG TPA: SPOR domain-containing protein [Candidatus Sulfotelmatobacter sp.]|jgi:cell division septation protein DedD
MASSQDTEITLGTGKLLALFFGLVVVCAVFFALGYTLGRKSEPTVAAAGPLIPLSSGNTTKPASSGSASAGMTFYKAVQQQSANPQLTPASSVAGTSQTGAGQTAETETPAASGKATDEAQNNGLPDPMAAVPGGNYFVQVAAVTKQDDADALVDALKKRTYPAFVAVNSASDKLFRVQVGPFSDVKEAEAMRARLINDGYNPILKK